MDLQARKISFVQEFLELQNEEIISSLEKILHKKKIELNEKNLKPMSMEEFNKEIDQAMEDSENEKMIEVSELRQQFRKKWK